jgi:hypothetical protein
MRSRCAVADSKSSSGRRAGRSRPTPTSVRQGLPAPHRAGRANERWARATPYHFSGTKENRKREQFSPKNRGFPEKNNTSTSGQGQKGPKSTGKAGRNNSANAKNTVKTAIFRQQQRNAENTEGVEGLRRGCHGRPARVAFAEVLRQEDSLPQD